MSKTITQAQYARLHHLSEAAANHLRAVQALDDEAISITQEKDQYGNPESYGHTTDLIWGLGGISVDQILDALGISVQNGRAAQAVKTPDDVFNPLDHEQTK